MSKPIPPPSSIPQIQQELGQARTLLGQAVTQIKGLPAPDPELVGGPGDALGPLASAIKSVEQAAAAVASKPHFPVDPPIKI